MYTYDNTEKKNILFHSSFKLNLISKVKNMKNSWRTVAHLSSYIKSGTVTKAGFRKLAIGSGFAVTTLGLAVKYYDSNSNITFSEANIKGLENAFCFNKLVSILDSNAIKAEEKSNISIKTHP